MTQPKKDVKEDKDVVKQKSFKTFLIDHLWVRKIIIIFSILLVVLGIFFTSYGWYSLAFKDNIFPNVKIGEVNFGGLNKTNADNLLKETIAKNQDKIIVFNFNDEKINLTPRNDLILEYKNEETLEKLFSVGRGKLFWGNLSDRLSLLFSPKNIFSVFEYDSQKLNNFLTNHFAGYKVPMLNANFAYKDNQIKISNSQTGQQIDSNKITIKLNELLGSFYLNDNINVVLEKIEPKITEDQLNDLEPKMQALLSADIILESEVKNITLDKSQIANWVEVVATNPQDKKLSFFPKAHALTNQFQAELDINQEKIKQYFSGIAKDINKDSRDAKLSFSDGRATVFQQAQKGYNLDIDANSRDLAKVISQRLNTSKNSSANSNSDKMTLKVEITEPDVSDANIDKLGIKEMVSSASTNFYGSPSNRIHNITVGANAFQGVVIKPGETLSAIGILGNPSAETGYLPELVIKENKTIPEYGGGLCQVSTTLFRASLNAGLEILERTNHLYRVSYYEPPVGMDATVYYPQPDLVIKNNTPAHLLIQAHVSGSTIMFEIYGTKDNRQVEISDPVILATLNPPEVKYIDTSDLASGETQRIESAHAGAKTTFHYKVTKDNQTIIEQDFASFYVPWQAVYLRGTGANQEANNNNNSQDNQQNNNSPSPTPSPSPTQSETPSPSPTPSPSSSII